MERTSTAKNENKLVPFFSNLCRPYISAARGCKSGRFIGIYSVLGFAGPFVFFCAVGCLIFGALLLKCAQMHILLETADNSAQSDPAPEATTHRRVFQIAELREGFGALGRKTLVVKERTHEIAKNPLVENRGQSGYVYSIYSAKTKSRKDAAALASNEMC